MTQVTTEVERYRQLGKRMGKVKEEYLRREIRSRCEKSSRCKYHKINWAY